MNQNNNPWLGLRSYEEEDKLYGRGKETEELSSIIINSFHTTIYGKSGIGKTSLLKAGVFPALRYEDYYPIYIRLEHDIDQGNCIDSYLTQIDDAINRLYQGVCITHVEGVPKSLSDIFDYYHFTTTKGIRLTPVFVFDQFEELFTLNDNKYCVETFFENISAILNNVDSEKSYRIVFCLREDYLYCIERYSNAIPAFKRNRYGLQDLSKENALEIITQPRKGLVEDEEANEILHKLNTGASNEVNATILSLYLSQLYDKMVNSGAESITSNIIRQFGDDIISSFYYENIKGISEKAISYLECHLVTAKGYRHNIPVEDALVGGVKKEEIELLKEKRILCVQLKHNNVQYVEFIHDVLCPIIIQHREYLEVKKHVKQIRRNLIIAFMMLVSGLVIFHFWYSSSQQQKREIQQKDNKLSKTRKELDITRDENYSIKVLNEQLSSLNILYNNKNDSLNKLCQLYETKDRENKQILSEKTVLYDELQKERDKYMSESSKLILENSLLKNLNKKLKSENSELKHQCIKLEWEKQDLSADAIQASRTTSDGCVVTKTCFVKAGESTKYSFTSSGYQELAVVAEAGGLITLRIHVSNKAGLNEDYNDTKDIKTGRSYRRTAFTLPESPKSDVRLEVINCSTKDICFVIIRNKKESNDYLFGSE